MGINLCLRHRVTFRDHIEWDCSKFAVDKTIVKWLGSKLPYEEVAWNPFTDDEPFRRPSDFEVWRQTIASITEQDSDEFEFMKERLTLMVDLLEKNPDYGVHISY